MAILFSIQSGNFSDISTWNIVNPVSYLDSRVSIQSLTSTTTNSTTTFIPGAITTSGILLQVGGRITSPSGTVTARLFNNTTSTIVKDVTINVTDLPNTGSTSTVYIGWTYFKFDSDVTLIAGNSYSIRAFSSISNQLSVYRDGTTNNWSRGLVTTTPQAPTVSDILITAGTYVSAGVNSQTTVTMNSTSTANTYGNIYIGTSGIFNYGVDEFTDYKLKFAGNMLIGMSGIFTIGTEAIPIPTSSSATLEMTCTTVGQYSINNFGTFITQGATRNIRSKLDADVAIGATSSVTTDVTDWKTGDVIVVPSTTRTTSQFETITLSSDSSGTSLSHSAYVYAHGGNSTTLVQADICLLTRNIKIFNTNPTTRGYITFQNNSTTIVRYTEFYNWGYSAGTALVNYAIAFAHTTLGTAIFEYNSYYATTRLSYSAFYLIWSSSSIIGNVFYSLSTFSSAGVTPITANLLDDNLVIANGGFSAVNGTMRNRNVIASTANHGIAGGVFRVGDSYDNNVYSNGALAMYLQGGNPSGFQTFNLKSWRNNIAISFIGTNGNSSNREGLCVFENFMTFGNAGNISFDRFYQKIIFNNSYFWGGDALHRTTFGFTTLVSTNFGQLNSVDSVYFNQCKFGIDYLGNINNFGTSCLYSVPGSSVILNSCTLSGVESITSSSYVVAPTYQNIGYVSINHNGIEGESRIFSRTFNALSDSTYTVSGEKSLRLVPSSATIKSYTPNVRVPVKKGTTCTVSVKVRESANVIDTQYNGTNPRLMWVYNPIAGNLTETICATYPDSVNLIPTPSENMTVWAVSPASTTVGSPGTSPIGYDNAYKVTIANGVNFSYTGSGTQTGIVSASIPSYVGTRNLSFYLKSAGLNIARIMTGAATTLSGAKYVTVNLDTGSIINDFGGDNPAIESVGNGWYRVSLDVTSISPTNNRFAVSLNDTVLTAGNGSDGVYIWGAQLTEGSGVKPYIPYGSWQTLSYTTPVMPYDTVLDFYVDCDGTSGWINVDDWKSTGADSRKNSYWLQNGPYIEADWTKPGGSYGFIS